MGLSLQFVLGSCLGLLPVIDQIPDLASIVRSSGSGRWSDPSTWEGNRPPGPGDRVQVQTGHAVIFDARVDAPIRSIHVAGTLSFDPDRDTVLTVGLIKIQAGDDGSESGFERHGMTMARENSEGERPSLLVGTQDRPIRGGRSATIRLAEVAGLDPEECPAIVCLGARMEFHGAEVAPTWVKLGRSIAEGDSSATLAEFVTGWKVGDRVIVTATRHQYHRNEDRTPRVLDSPWTEERRIKAIDGRLVTFDVPLAMAHAGEGDYRGEVALLSRNVVVESAKPDGVRGHTMYHRNSIGSISFAEFRHLGKLGKLGKYSLHFHRAGDSMRGASIVGASIWDSDNRWITIHGTNRLVVRDCVGYRSIGHGFFLEDGTEVDNILDHNLAVQATEGVPLPGQALPDDRNEGAGFWWANSRNAFTRNSAVECDAYGYRFEPPTAPDFDPVLKVRGTDGRTAPVDIRTQPFLRFDNNEAHAQRRYGFNLGGASGRDHPEGESLQVVGPDSKHPFAIRDFRVWDAHWGFSPGTPSVLVEGLAIAHCEYGIWKPNFDRHSYRKVAFAQCGKAYFGVNGHPPDEAAFPSPLDPLDDRPPVTVITRVGKSGPGQIKVSGSSADDGRITLVRINGREARPIVADFSRWELEVDAPTGSTITLTASAEDAAGNVERTPHRLTITAR